MFPIMIKEEDKYRSEVFKIAGFSCLVPFGNLILSIPGYKFENFNIQYIVFVIIALGSFFLGIILISRGLYMVAEERNTKWIR